MNWKSIHDKAHRNLQRWDVIKKDKQQQALLGKWLFSLGVSTGATFRGYPKDVHGDVIRRKVFAAAIKIEENNVFDDDPQGIPYGSFTSKKDARLIGLKKGLYYVRRQAKKRMNQSQTA